MIKIGLLWFSENVQIQLDKTSIFSFIEKCGTFFSFFAFLKICWDVDWFHFFLNFNLYLKHDNKDHLLSYNKDKYA